VCACVRWRSVSIKQQAGASIAASPAHIADVLRRGACPPDAAFDALLPEDICALSGDQWTPLEVALAAANWLKDSGVRRVVDIGSGPGKFCIAAALAGSCEFIGLEQNWRFVAVARSLARLFGVQSQVRFMHAELDETSLPEGEAYYIYNPFAQHLFDPSGAAKPNYERYRRDVALAQEAFRRARAGTIVITYNGFGGLMPSSYEMCRVDRELPCVLRMWRKVRLQDDGGFSVVDAD